MNVHLVNDARAVALPLCYLSHRMKDLPNDECNDEPGYPGGVKARARDKWTAAERSGWRCLGREHV